jgi:hypothetical protein
MNIIELWLSAEMLVVFECGIGCASTRNVRGRSMPFIVLNTRWSRRAQK